MMRKLAAFILSLVLLAASSFDLPANEVQLNWHPSTDVGGSGVAGYNIYRDGIKIGTSATATYTDMTALPGTTYSYTVSAVDNAGNESAQSMPFVITTSGSATTVFSALHTYYISPTGNDSNDGLTQQTPWKTVGPHTVACGDVIIALPGDYADGPFYFDWGDVTGCPSTSGGIDGNGGIYFAILLCGGNDLVSCTSAFRFTNGAHNWAVEGFLIHDYPSSRGFEVRVVSDDCNTYFTSHHIASINNIVYNTAQAFGSNDCGKGGGENPPAFDYAAAVGTIAQNSAQDSICLGAIDFVGMGQTDSNASAIKGFMAGNFAIHNRNPSCDALYDNEGLMLDTLDAHNSNGIWNVFNNVSYDSGRYGFQLFWQCASTVPFTVNYVNNTTFANNADAVTQGSLAGDVNVQANDACRSYDPIPVTINIANNISLANYGTSPGSGYAAIYAMVASVHNSETPDTWSHWGLLTNGTAGSENVYKGQLSTCVIYNGVGGCDPGNNITWSDSISRLGTNFFVDPAFTNTADLLANHVGPPDCTGFVSVTECMGWNAYTQTLTTPSVIGDLTASCAQCAGKGYQRPSVNCATSGPFHDLFPPWLKGIVYLHWDSNTGIITQRHDLITLPCGY